MKHVNAFFLVLIISISTSIFAAEPFSGVMSSDKRELWWKNRILYLNAEKEKIVTLGISTIVVPLIDRDINRAEDMVSGFNNSTETDTPVKKELKNEELLNFVKKRVSSIYSIKFKKFFLENSGKKEMNIQSSTILASAIQKSISNYLNGGKYSSEILLPGTDNPDHEKLIDLFISQNQKKFLFLEMYINTCVESYSSGLEKNSDSVYKDIKFSLGKEPYTVNEKELSKKIDTLADQKIDTNISEGLVITEKSLEDSWSWKETENKIKNKINCFKSFSEILGRKNTTLTSDELSYSFENPVKSEGVIFAKKRSSFPKIGSVDPSYAFDAIDQTRSKILKNISGRETDESFNKFQKEMDSAANEKISPSDLSAIKSQISEYVTSSIEFLKIVSQAKKNPAENEVSDFSYKISQTRTYINFMLLLENSSADSFSLSGNTEDMYSSLGKRTDEFLKTLSYMVSIDPEIRPLVSKEGLSAISRDKSDFVKFYQDSLKEIHDLRKERKAGAKVDRSENMKEAYNNYKNNAARETASLSDSVNDALSVYDELKYPVKVLGEYGDTYNSLLQDVKNGIFSEKLNSTLKSGSVFEVMNGYDSEKLSREVKARQYLRSYIMKDAAGLKVITDFYKKKGVDVRPFAQADMAKIQSRLSLPQAVRISNWKMSETNYTEIDKNASNFLTQHRNKKIFDRDSAITGNSSLPDTQVSLDKMKLTIPYGWEKQELKPDGAPELLAVFINSTDNSVINVFGYDGTGKTEKDILDDYTRSTGKKTVQIGTDKADGKHLFWTIAKDKEGKIIKAVAFEHEGKIFIVSGESSKKAFPAFNGRIDSITRSVKF